MEEVSGRAAAAAHSEARGVVRRRDGVDGLRPAGATLRSGLRERAGRPHSRRSHRRKSSPLLRSALQVPAGPPRPSLSQPSVLLSLSRDAHAQIRVAAVRSHAAGERVAHALRRPRPQERRAPQPRDLRQPSRHPCLQPRFHGFSGFYDGRGAVDAAFAGVAGFIAEFRDAE